MNSHISVSKSCCSLKTEEVSSIKIIFKIFMRQWDKVVGACRKMKNQKSVIFFAAILMLLVKHPGTWRYSLLTHLFSSHLSPPLQLLAELLAENFGLQSRDIHCLRADTSQVSVVPQLCPTLHCSVACRGVRVPRSKPGRIRWDKLKTSLPVGKIRSCFA